MPRKSLVNRARAANLKKNMKYLPKWTNEEVKDGHFPCPDSHGCCNAIDAPREDDITIAVIKFYSINLILSTRSHSLRNWSLCMGIFVILIPNSLQIELYWGAVKFHYCGFCNRLTSVEEMEIRIQVLECLNSVPLLQIRWWAFLF